MTDSQKRDKFRVTTKVAIFSPDNKKILLTRILAPGPYSDYGLPGGHMDSGESPTGAAVRELQEELGVTVTHLERRDFFMHPNGKVVLGFSATLSESTQLVSSEPEKEHGEWVNMADFKKIRINETYRRFVMRCYKTK